MSKFNNMDQISIVFKRLFETDDGKDLLFVLEKRFEEPALTPPAAVDGMALALMTQQRLGEANVVKYIKSLIKRELSNDSRTD